MRRDHNEPALAAHHAARRGERGFLIREMFEHADQQDEVKMLAAGVAEADRIVGAKPELPALSDPPRAFDHRFADIHPEAVVDHRRELDQHLPGCASEIENARSAQPAAELAQVTNSRREFGRPRRVGSMLHTP